MRCDVYVPHMCDVCLCITFRRETILFLLIKWTQFSRLSRTERVPGTVWLNKRLSVCHLNLIWIPLVSISIGTHAIPQCSKRQCSILIGQASSSSLIYEFYGNQLVTDHQNDQNKLYGIFLSIKWSEPCATDSVGLCKIENLLSFGCIIFTHRRYFCFCEQSNKINWNKIYIRHEAHRPLCRISIDTAQRTHTQFALRVPYNAANGK